jgi:hypothetical protein
MPFDIIVGRNESDKKDFGKRGLAFREKVLFQWEIIQAFQIQSILT